MRKFTRIFITLFTFSALIMSSLGAAQASVPQTSIKHSSAKAHNKTPKASKSPKPEKSAKATKTKNSKKSKKVNKNKKAKKNTKLSMSGKANKKRVANFAPNADPSPTELPACDVDTDPTCEPTPIIDPTCDPMIDKLCQPDPIDPTCDPDLDSWCEIIVDPEPTDPPTGGPDPYPTPEESSSASAAWQVYFDSVNKAQLDFQEYVTTLQDAFTAATADALTTRDAAIASATSFAEIVAAVRDYRMATAEEKAKLDQNIMDASEALNLLVKQAWDVLVSSGEITEPIFWCGLGRDGGKEHAKPPVVGFAKPNHDKRHSKPRH